jgi:hypothetical protein
VTFPSNRHIGSITTNPLTTRISIKNTGPNIGAAILRNKKDEPHIAERIRSSMKSLEVIFCMLGNTDKFLGPKTEKPDQLQIVGFLKC